VLFVREGRSLRLTAAGETLLEYARRLLALNNEAYRNISGRQLRGRVRLGMLQDFGTPNTPGLVRSVCTLESSCSWLTNFRESRNLASTI
jgi:DNA-binding transcriptional LysR family regulator